MILDGSRSKGPTDDDDGPAPDDDGPAPPELMALLLYEKFFWRPSYQTYASYLESERCLKIK